MRKLRVAVIGLGWFGRKHVSTWQSMKDVKIVGAADITYETSHSGAPSAQAKFHAADVEGAELSFPVYRTLEELLRHCKDVDVVDVVVNEKNHYAVASSALNSGKSVIIEKPVVLSPSHARRLRDLAREKRLHVYPGHLLRFDQRARFVKDGMDQMGQVRYMSFRRNFQPQSHDVYGRETPFFTALVHDVDLALWLTQNGKPYILKSVARHFLDKKHPDLITVLMEFDNRTICHIENVWHVSRSCPYGFENEMALYGEKRTVIVRNEPVVQIWDGDGVEYPEFFFWPYVGNERQGALRAMLEHYADCARAGIESSVVSMEDAVRTIEVCDALRRASR